MIQRATSRATSTIRRIGRKRKPDQVRPSRLAVPPLPASHADLAGLASHPAATTDELNQTMQELNAADSCHYWFWIISDDGEMP